jgi:serine/threonine-protein kinase
VSRDRYAPGALVGGKLRIDALLGRGGMGAVYAATHVGLGQRVAVKLLSSEAAESREAVQRFEQEAQIVSRLSSPHVVRVFDMGETEHGDPYLVMELLEGHDLAALVSRPAAIPVPTAVELVLEAALGVAVAHASGLVHRDLKPANLFLARNPDGTATVKVLDFGLTKLARPGDAGLTQSAASFGTPQYMAPEQIMSAKHVDARCDQHALAMILYELCTKAPPYVAPTPAALTVLIVTRPPPSARVLRSDVPVDLDRALMKAMAKKPTDRFEDLGAFARAIAPFASPRGAALAGAIERTLAAAGAAGRPPTPFAEDELVTVPKTPTIGGISSGRWALRTSPLSWGVAAALVTVAVGSTIAIMSHRAPDRRALVVADAPATSAAPESSQGGAASPRSSAPTRPDVEPAPAPSPSAAGSASAAPSATSLASATSAAPRPARPAPSTDSTRRPPRDPHDPVDVFGR